MTTQRTSSHDIINADPSVDLGSTQRMDETGNRAETLRADTSTTAIITADAPPGVGSALNGTLQLGQHSIEIIELIIRSGEAEVYLVRHNNEQAVFKYYYTTFIPKQEVVDKLAHFHRLDIVRIVAFGTYQGRFYEINEYMTGGTLSVITPLTNLDQLKAIIRQVVEALHFCHQNGIIHRDIKPDNIFFRDPDRKQIALGDFGIASSLQEGQDLRKTTIARTSLFAAPELFNNIAGKTILGKKVDYYAVGISILELWSGKETFGELGDFGISYAKLNGRVPIPQDLPKEWQQLIKGFLTVADMDRWGYDEFVAWSLGKPVKLAYVENTESYRRFEFDKAKGIFVDTPQEMVRMIKEHPQKATVHLYSHAIARWIEPVSQDTYTQLYNVVELEHPHSKPAGLIKAMYLLDTEIPYEAANGSMLQSSGEIAVHLENNLTWYQSALTDPDHSLYLFLEARSFWEQATEFRLRFNNLSTKRALNSVILDLQDPQAVHVGNHIIHLADELLNLDDAVREQWITPALTDPDSKLSIWLSGDIECSHRLAKWRQTGRTDVVSIGYALGVQGFRINEEEALTVDAFKTLIQRQAIWFVHPTGGTTVREEADHWLRTYQGSNLPDIVADELDRISSGRDELKVWCRYLFKEWGDIDTRYELIPKVIGPAQRVFDTNPTDWQELAIICLPAVEGLLWSVRKQSESGASSLDNVVTWLRTVSSPQPLFAHSIINTLGPVIDQLVSKDLQEVRLNNQQFNQVRNEVDAFVRKQLLVDYCHMPFVKAWALRQQILQQKTEEIEAVHNTSRQHDLAALHKQFVKLLQKNAAVNDTGLLFWGAFFGVCLFIYVPMLMYSSGGTSFSFFDSFLIVVLVSGVSLGVFAFVEWPIEIAGRLMNWLFYRSLPQHKIFELSVRQLGSLQVPRPAPSTVKSSNPPGRSNRPPNTYGTGRTGSPPASNRPPATNALQLLEAVHKKYDTLISQQTAQETVRIFLLPQEKLPSK